MTSLVALLVRLILLVVFTFGFVVLYEHGVANYPANAKQDFQDFLSFVESHAPANLHLPGGGKS
jgi:hypothetical protein